MKAAGAARNSADGGLLERSARGGTIVVGPLNLGGSIEMIPNPVAVAELAVDKQAATLLMPVSARRALNDLPDDLWTKINVEFYGDPADGVFKAPAGVAAPPAVAPDAKAQYDAAERRFGMSKFRFGVLLVVVLGLSLAVAGVRSAENSEATTGESPEFQYIGKLAFGPEGVVFAADTQDVSITALHLGDALAGGVPGTQDVPAIDRKVAGLLGIDAGDLLITDMVVDPSSRNTWLSVMRGMGADAVPVLLRVDGAGEIEVVSFEGVRYTRIGVPNPPPAATPLELAGGRSIPVPNYPDAVDPAGLIGVQTITHMAFVDGNLFVSGLSNEEFASKMRVIPYPFRVANAGTSVEIYHGSHGQLETFSPVFTFVPYEIDGEPSIVASYLCTPLVKFPIAALEPGSKIQGTTIAEFGNRNRPIDMIVYEKDGQDYILLSNNQRGVMKVPTAPFAAADAIAEAIPDTAGVPFETIASLEGVQQLDKLDDSQAMLLVAAAGGGLNLEAAALP